MPATLIVEDGSGVANANSYGTVAGARAYALNRAVVLSAVDTDVISQLILATDYLESYRNQYVGTQTLFTQALSWPRQNVLFTLDTPYPSNAIPPQLINAQYEAVIAQFNGTVLQPTIDYSQGGYITESKVDVILTKYSEKVGTSRGVTLPKVMSLLQTLLIAYPVLQNVRV